MGHRRLALKKKKCQTHRNLFSRSEHSLFSIIILREAQQEESKKKVFAAASSPHTTHPPPREGGKCKLRESENVEQGGVCDDPTTGNKMHSAAISRCNTNPPIRRVRWSDGSRMTSARPQYCAQLECLCFCCSLPPSRVSLSLH